MTAPFRRALAGAILLLSACDAKLPAPDAIVAAERAFAADGYARGVKSSFLEYSAPDAIMFDPGPVNAHALLAAAPDEDLAEPRRHLVWWPLYAGISRSGDLGFTTGPYAIDEDRRGHYFTIWRREPDGAWKWVLDAGVGADASAEAAQGAPASFLQTSRARSASADAALRAVALIEERIAAAAPSGVQSAYEPYLDADSRLHSEGPPPAKSADGRGAVFAARPRSALFAPLGGGASKAGDLAWTYGEARWREGEAERVDHYVRVWQKRDAGWRLVFDEHLPSPQ